LLNVGIIGLGVGEQHIAGFNQTRNATVTHLCDLDHKKLQKLTSKHGVKHSSVDSNDIIDDPNVDIVSIASYDDYHASQVVRAIDNGKHVFVEKPLCLFLEEAVQIAAALRKRPNLKLSSNLILRCSPRFRDLKARISAGELGEVFAMDADYNYGRLEKLIDGWRGEIDFYSVFLGGGVHMVDLIRWLTGAEVEEVFATGNRVAAAGSRFQYADYVCALLRLSDGMRAKVSANFGCVHPHFHGLSVYGTKATFINGSPDASLFSSRDPEGAAEKIDTAYPGCAKGDLIGGFLDEIRGEGSMEVTAEEIFRTMAVCFAAEQSLSTGQPVEVEPILKLLL
tara:strand:- start:3376 stop:4389 length:1014 start_codon:yes stop_codon:yes gene_type:complete